MLDLIIKNGQCYIDGELKDVDISVKEGKIQNIGKITEEAKDNIDAKGLTVLPGCIDTQTHFREPGSTDTEDLHSGSRAAIAGGITAVFEMPNTNPPTSNKKEFQRKLDLAKNRMYCNYAFYFGATADNADELADLKNLEGCCGIKLFAGSSTGNLLVADEKDIETVFQNSSKVVAVHSEDEEILNINKKLIKKGDVHSHPIWRSDECAISSTRRIVRDYPEKDIKNKDKFYVTYVRYLKFIKNKDFKIIQYEGARFIDTKNTFIKTPFVTGNFLFLESNFLKDIPYDNTLDYLHHGEEILHSLRFYTYGYDIFIPNQNIIYHNYLHKEPKIWNDIEDMHSKRINAHTKLVNVFKSKTNNDANKFLGIYNLGNNRTIKNFKKFANITNELEEISFTYIAIIILILFIYILIYLIYY